MFNGQAAPLFYLAANQINAQVPYSVAGAPEVLVEVRFKGAARAAVSVPVAQAVPGVFTMAGGKGQVVAINQDGSVNSEANPASRGSVITLFVTGEGQTDPSGVSGKPSQAPYPKPLLPVSVSIGRTPAELVWAGSAPDLAGLLQINARVPGGFLPSGQLELSVAVGAASTQAGVTIAVR